MFRTSPIRLLSNADSGASFTHILFRPLVLTEYNTNHNLGGFKTGTF